MNRFYTLIFMLLLAGSNAFAQRMSPALFMTSRLTGDQQNPAVSTDAMGLASYVWNADRTALSVRAHFTGLSGAITGCHLHAGFKGENGPVIFNLIPGLNGNVLNYTVSGITPDQLSLFLREGYYINVHTAANPNGEIRGQTVPETDWSFMAYLTGGEEVPAVSSNARGLALFNLSQDMKSVEFFAVTSGLKIQMAHLHMAPTGSNGGVVLDLVPFVQDQTWVKGRTAVTPALASAMIHDSLYMNVHTTAHPNGEIRGQLHHKPGAIYFDARLTAAEQVPANNSPAVGLAVFTLAPTLDTILVRSVLGDSLTSSITGSHIHSGARSTNGGVIVNLEPYRFGNRHDGIITGQPVTNDLINSMLSGQNYMNVHTSSFPNGEIRGQLYKTAREGYTFFLDGSQQVPPVTTPGKGFAALSVDRDETSLHYMVNWADLTGPATGAHFHAGMAGQTGPVIFNIFNTVTGTTSMGYWNQNSTPAFDSTMARRVWNDSMYVNVHTAANPNGEVRGQTERVVMALRPTLPRNPGFELMPNPATATLTLRGTAEPATVVLRSAAGTAAIEGILAPGQRLDVQALPPGLYFYQIRTGKAQNTGKLVKL